MVIGLAAIGGIVSWGTTQPSQAATPGGTELVWYGQSAFKLTTPSGKVLWLDPWLQNPANPEGKAILNQLDRADLVLVTHGHGVRPIQYLAVVVGGMFAGIGGVHLSTAYTKAWFENMAQGRGFVAVAVVMFAARQPFKVAGGAYLFGAALALSPALQARGYGINQFALDAVPYLVTLVVLILLGRRRANDQPEGLSKVFDSAPAS